MAEQGRTKLRVTACSAVYHGKNQAGHSYTIYEITAEKPDGTPVAENLRSFEELPEGEVLDLKVTTFDHPEYGRSYTLGRIGGSGSAKKIKDLEDRVTALEETCARLLEMVAGEAAQNA